MAITNHSQLVQAVQDWMMDRSDLASFAPDCITLAESYLNYGGNWDMHDRPLRCRQMETVADLVADETYTDRYTLPEDYLEYKAISTGTQPSQYSMSYLERNGANVWYPSRPSGNSNSFTIIGNYLTVYPTSGSDIRLIYYARIPALTTLTPENWLLSANPNIYLYGALMMAADKVKFAEEIEKYATMLRSFVSGMNESDRMGRMARAGLSLRGPCP